MKGRGIPVEGMELVTTAMLISTWVAMCASTPVAIRPPNKSVEFIAMIKMRHTNRINSSIRAKAPNRPSSSQMTENIISL